MDARKAAIVLAILACSVTGASFRTQNFIVTATSPSLAREVAVSAERYRKELASEWLGYELKPWNQPIPIRVHSAGHLGAGGVTSFVFVDNVPGQWQMTLQGTRQRVLDSVLPHEISHTVFATHFGRPLPRWADEGACTTVEHASEKQKQHALLLRYLTTNRGIPFNQMLRMKDYPRDIMTLYSQGFSVSQYLIAHHGKQTFINFLERAMQDQDWDTAIAQFYPFENASDLQTKWVTWVGKGNPRIQPSNSSPSDLQAIAVKDRRSDSVSTKDQALNDEKLVPIGYRPDLSKPVAIANQNTMPTQIGDGWTSRHKSKNTPSPSPNLASFSRVIHRGEDAKTEVSRPQPVNQSRPIILQASTESEVSNRVTEVQPPRQAGHTSSKLKWLSPR
ncbi:MAG: hypothetical protein VX776_10490 [Planctomycetota bacterium]|nr:hypothetical protein [Planctomycetota bacterium]